MQFRWAAAIALWTLLAGPVFDSHRPNGNPVSSRKNPQRISSLINHCLAGDDGRLASRCESGSVFSAAS